MAQIDVSDITLDPYLAGTSFVVLRRLSKVNDFGEGILTVASLPAVGAIYPSGDNSLARQEAFETQGNSITVVTRFALRGAGKDEQGNLFQPDIVLWEGNHYQVRSINDYNRYGVGFYEVECTSIDYQVSAETSE